jgi:hypothetical protein
MRHPEMLSNVCESQGLVIFVWKLEALGALSPVRSLAFLGQVEGLEASTETRPPDL